MRILVLGGLLLAIGAHAAGAADYPEGYRSPQPAPPMYGERVAPLPDDDDDDVVEEDRQRWREPRRPHYADRPHRYDRDDADCWIRRTPYGPERVCR